MLLGLVADLGEPENARIADLINYSQIELIHLYHRRLMNQFLLLLQLRLLLGFILLIFLSLLLLGKVIDNLFDGSKLLTYFQGQ